MLMIVVAVGVGSNGVCRLSVCVVARSLTLTIAVNFLIVAWSPWVVD